MSSSSLVTGALPLGSIGSPQPGHRTTGKVSSASLPMLRSPESRQYELRARLWRFPADVRKAAAVTFLQPVNRKTASWTCPYRKPRPAGEWVRIGRCCRLMWDLCRLTWWALGDLFRPRAKLEAEILVLRQQINVLRRTAPKRLLLSSIDRLIFVGLYRLFPDVRGALAIVKPETVIRWHRAGFRAYWRRRSGPRAGRPQHRSNYAGSSTMSVWPTRSGARHGSMVSCLSSALRSGRPRSPSTWPRRSVRHRRAGEHSLAIMLRGS